MTITAILIHPNGDAERVDVRTRSYGSDGDDMDLKHVYELLDCTCITAVSIPDALVTGCIGWADDEGLFVANPEFNFMASMIARQNLVGRILITGHRGPATVSVSDETLEFFLGELTLVGESDD